MQSHTSERTTGPGLERVRQAETLLESPIHAQSTQRATHREPRPRRRPGGRAGQSTVEFMLMLPVLLAIFFFVIEMSLYFTAIHYTNYATFTVARSKLAGYRNADGQQTASFVAGLILTGSALEGNYTVTDKTNGISVKLQSWRTTFPYLAGIMPDAPFTTTVNLGPNERVYETRAFTGCADNDMSSNPC